MIKLVLVRHGQSAWNLENKFTGWTDVPLSENGIEEALYQGVISNKNDIKHKFHKMRNQIQNRDTIFVAEEWENMKKLLETIVFAFK